MRYFRYVILPAFFTLSFFALIAYTSYRSNNDYQLGQGIDMSVNNNVFVHENMPLTSTAAHQ